MELRGNNGLLTGAAGGIGTAIARRLANEGVTLVLSGRQEAPLEDLRESLPGNGHRVMTADLGDRAVARSFIAEVEAEAGPIDLLVNNAGIEISSIYDRLEPEEIESLVDLNLLAPMLLTHAVIPGMLKRGRGHIVQMSSTGGLAGVACTEPYTATKGGLIRFTEALRATYADTPLGFTAVCPGFSKGGGMYARMEADGHSSNLLLGNTTIEAVADAVVKGVTGNLPLVVSNNRPIRPVAALTMLAPKLAARLLERSGTNRIFREVAAGRESNR